MVKSVGGHVRIYTEVEMRTKMRGAGLHPTGAGHAHALHSAYWWLKCAVGPRNDDHWLVKPYNRLLVWDIEKTGNMLGKHNPGAAPAGG